MRTFPHCTKWNTIASLENGLQLDEVVYQAFFLFEVGKELVAIHDGDGAFLEILLVAGDDDVSLGAYSALVHAGIFEIGPGGVECSVDFLIVKTGNGDRSP